MCLGGNRTSSPTFVKKPHKFAIGLDYLEGWRCQGCNLRITSSVSFPYIRRCELITSIKSAEAETYVPLFKRALIGSHTQARSVA